jgi:NADH dehydrogenase [ubiquinone] 1 alpha subcomplex assembly factor 1
MRMDLGINPPPLTLYSFTSSLPPVEKPEFLARGSDEDIGGYSTNALTPVPETTLSSASDEPIGSNAAAGPSMSHIAFHGNMSLRVPQEFAGRIRTGYAGIRNRKRMTLFGEDTWDLSHYSHLRLKLAYRGWEGWRNRWYCNIQTDGPILCVLMLFQLSPFQQLTDRTDLFQYRLEIPPSPASTLSTAPLDVHAGPPPEFVTLHLPLSSFVLTNSGHTSEKQMEMLYSRIRTVGFSLLGGGRGEEGLPMPVKKFTAEEIAEKRRLAGAGFGKGGGHEDPDPIVEEMLRQDGIDLKAKKVDPVRASGYHRVGESAGADVSRASEVGEDAPAPSASSGPSALRAREETAVKVTPWSEGYYELCIKSVEAVNYDAMAEDEGPESADM